VGSFAGTETLHQERCFAGITETLQHEVSSKGNTANFQCEGYFANDTETLQ
jgi:hypothetical protein